ncbi:DUF3253 domain-containing protein [Sulfitobacter sp. F26169L]|uniref:DUF3253 domain-containing protein n=1 Tax=Sulfitobacter sp. F26169L TaxID=2996015 RepID=UPI002260DEB7|nr:DUF3253 domain-containing protein [Sulfitobacter sp. F26169L]MCX7567862.1 DUF3253 domain-containing protein [Sulfitobacter sp. F26169L]
MKQIDKIDNAILKLAAERGMGKTICPSEVARHVGGRDEADWRPLMDQVKERAIKLARSGKIMIKKGGQIIDFDDFHGIYRITVSEKDQV